ncbi:MAG: efflux RND transporter periplasmic adaptor subunit [Planctomycetes bacterium]|nr:efflux RND transporter periplasmic adaptor subunit [Planctomycetota bacterium]MCW8135251.1 efflux RND transporter periplasmic adaptor subunit [Planctomycetota bacterium]
MKRLLCLAMLLAACTPPEPAPGAETDHGPMAPTNRIDIPPQVIQNLGITFARVEMRRVAQTMRLPGVLEATPDANRDYRAPLGGQVTLLAQTYKHVNQGDLVARIDSPEWHELQRELHALEAATAERESDVSSARAALAAAQASIDQYQPRADSYQPQLAALVEHRRRLTEARDQWAERVKALQELEARGMGRALELADARLQLAGAESGLAEEAEKRAGLEREVAQLGMQRDLERAQLPVLEAALQSAQTRASAAASAFALRVRSAGAVLSLPAGTLEESWRDMAHLELRAAAPGIVMDWHVANGSRVDAGASLMSVMDHAKLRVRARLIQGDLARLKPGMRGSAVSPAGETASGQIAFAPMADSDTRMVDVLLNLDQPAAWAMPGLLVEVEVVWDETAHAEMAVPSRALIRDGLDMVLFVRDPKNPDKVIREKPQVGISDGRWTVVYSGCAEGDEIVLDGVYELKLTGTGKPTGKGHFHADGTWHEGDH